jgi:hypothetical protein
MSSNCQTAANAFFKQQQAIFEGNFQAVASHIQVVVSNFKAAERNFQATASNYYYQYYHY